MTGIHLSDGRGHACVLSWARHSFCGGGPAGRKFGSRGSPGRFQRQLPRNDPPIILDIAPTFADDGVIAGDEPEVLRAIQHMKRVLPLVGLRFSMMQVVAAEAGTQDPERFRAFHCGAGWQFLKF